MLCLNRLELYKEFDFDAISINTISCLCCTNALNFLGISISYTLLEATKFAFPLNMKEVTTTNEIYNAAVTTNLYLLLFIGYEASN